MKNLWKVCVILALVAVIGAPVWAQTSVAARAALAQQLGHAVPVVPTAAAGHNRPFIWVAASFGARPAGNQPSLPSFCNRGNGYFNMCPNAMATAYGLSQIVGGNGGAGMTIAIVDAFYYANAEADLIQFSSDMGLLSCSVANGCFKMVDQRGAVGPGSGSTDSGWELETMLDIEWAHAMAPKAKILLVHSDTNGFDDMGTAVLYAQVNSDIVSNSYGAGEFAGETGYDFLYEYSPVPILASSGDGGAPGIYPCFSPFVTCVGGTTLNVNPTTFVRTSETGWSGSGGGCSTQEPGQGWQTVFTSICGSYRAAPDVAADADPNTGAIVLDSGNGGYYRVGGTSLASPLTAAIFADIMTARVSFGKVKFGSMNPVLYQAAVNNYGYFYYDVTSGYNGFAAGPGYDLVTGLGVSKAADMANRFFGLIYPPVGGGG